MTVKKFQSSLPTHLPFFILFCLFLTFATPLSFYIKGFTVVSRVSLVFSVPSPLPPPPPPPPPPAKLIHRMRDGELLRKARVRGLRHKGIPKIAFMFLTKNAVTFAPLWEKFFKGYERFYSIYVHTSPSFNGSVGESLIFRSRRIPSKEVKWGTFSMLQAERRLLGNALLDLSNERFILLSESCIPLFNFTTVYSYLMNSTKSYVQVYDEASSVGRGRYSPKMKPYVMLEQWRKGSQWFEMDRALAIEIVSDKKYFDLFRRFCKPSCYVDEHYIPTLVNIKFSEWNTNRTLTWVDWSKGGPHPRRFTRPDITEELLHELRDGKKCDHNGKPTNICYLFARKFVPNTLDRLLKFSPTVMGFN